MPFYEYACECCGLFECRRPVAERDAPLACPQCQRPAQRKANYQPVLLRRQTAPTPPPAINPHGADCSCCGPTYRVNKTPGR